MTYNYRDWTPGDLAWVTPHDGEFSERRSGRQLRMLVRREQPGPSQVGGRMGYPVGALHWVNENGWINAIRSELIVSAEPAIAVAPEVLAQQNDVAPVTIALHTTDPGGGYQRQSTTWASGWPAPPNRLTVRDLQWAQPPTPCIPGCPVCAEAGRR